MSNFPYVSPELLEELKKRFPERSPQIGESHNDLLWRGGQCSVIALLESKFKDQAPKNRG